MKHNLHTILALWTLLVFVPLQAQTRLSLSQCKEMAQHQDPAIKNAQLSILAAQAQRQEAKANYFPTVSITSFGFWALNPMIQLTLEDVLGKSTFTDQLQNILDQVSPRLGIHTRFDALEYGYSAQIMLTQPVYAGGRIVTGNRLAQVGEQAATLQARIQQRNSLEQIEKDYWQVVLLEEKKTTLVQLHQLLDTLAKDIQSAIQAGLRTETDLLQVQLKQGELRQGILQLEQGIRLSKMDLFNRIGQPYRLLPDQDPQSSIPALDQIVLSDRPDSLQQPSVHYVPEDEIVVGMDESQLLQLSVQAKALEKRMALGEALPQVGIGASYGYSQLVNGYANGTAYAMIQIPLSDWGKVSRKVKRQDYLLQQAQNDKEYLSGQLLLLIRQQWLEVTTTWDKLALARQNEDLAQRTWENQSRHFDAGLIPLAELLQAQTALQQAKEAHLDAEIAYRNAVVAYTGHIRNNQP